MVYLELVQADILILLHWAEYERVLIYLLASIHHKISLNELLIYCDYMDRDLRVLLVAQREDSGPFQVRDLRSAQIALGIAVIPTDVATFSLPDRLGFDIL